MGSTPQTRMTYTYPHFFLSCKTRVRKCQLICCHVVLPYLYNVITLSRQKETGQQPKSTTI